MFYLESFCYTCFGLNDLQTLTKLNHGYLYNKINIHLPEILNRNPGILIMCKICCDKIRKNRKFTKRNLVNMKLLNDYISKLNGNCTESTYKLLRIDVTDMYPKSMGNTNININNEIKLTLMTDSQDEEKKNYLDLSNEKIKQILNDLNGYQNNNTSYLSNSSLDVLYSNYNINSEKKANLEKTTDGEYLENIQKLNETDFDNTDIETIIHSGYSYEIDLTNSCDNIIKSVSSTITQSEYNIINNCDDKKINLVSNDTTTTPSIKMEEETETHENLVISVSENGLEVKEENGITNGDMIIDVKPFECETCKRRFETDVYLKLHKTRVHSNTSIKLTKEDLKCSICEKVFKIHSQLVKHALTHSNDRPFLCTICKKGFKTERNRKAHMLYHTELKFACTICNKKFVTNGILKDHLLTHSDPKFKCSICSRAFTVENYLKKHLKTHNEAEKKFQCETCSKRFLYKSNYVAHSLTCTVPNPNVTFTNNVNVVL